MPRITFLLFLIIAIRLWGSPQRVSLQAALDKKWVAAKAISLGGYQGFCMSVSVKNLSKDSLIVLIEPGRKLNSIDEQNQDILIVKQQILALKANEQKQVEIKGYCCQVSNHAPPIGAKYDVNTLADSDLVKLARFLDLKEFDRNAEQEAIWAISDKRSSANISSENDSLTQSLREMTAMLKGEELPWYRILSKKYVYENGVIYFVSLRLLGLISYSNDAENYATLDIKNEQGLQVCQIKSDWLRPCTNGIYKLDLPIKGLPSGKYIIELNVPGKQLAKREFEI